MTMFGTAVALLCLVSLGASSVYDKYLDRLKPVFLSKKQDAPPVVVIVIAKDEEEHDMGQVKLRNMRPEDASNDVAGLGADYFDFDLERSRKDHPNSDTVSLRVGSFPCVEAREECRRTCIKDSLKYCFNNRRVCTAACSNVCNGIKCDVTRNLFTQK